ncbi:hypothetical protein AGMMS49944_16320 [Spirochaetia bacterium]|nr:hypothetical protein AGMMS49944_16320 [Spirochaetia bacterium]
MKYHHGKWLVEITPDLQNPYNATMVVREGGYVVCQELNIAEIAARFSKKLSIRQAYSEELVGDTEIINALLRGGELELSKEITVLDKDSYFDYMALCLIDCGIKAGYWKA